MKVVGNLELDSKSQIKNLNIEHVDTLPTINPNDKGRVVFCELDKKAYYNNGTEWTTSSDSSVMNIVRRQIWYSRVKGAYWKPSSVISIDHQTQSLDFEFEFIPTIQPGDSNHIGLTLSDTSIHLNPGVRIDNGMVMLKWSGSGSGREADFREHIKYGEINHLRIQRAAGSPTATYTLNGSDPIVESTASSGATIDIAGIGSYEVGMISMKISIDDVPSYDFDFLSHNGRDKIQSNIVYETIERSPNWDTTVYSDTAVDELGRSKLISPSNMYTRIPIPNPSKLQSIFSGSTLEWGAYATEPGDRYLLTGSNQRFYAIVEIVNPDYSSSNKNVGVSTAYNFKYVNGSDVTTHDYTVYGKARPLTSDATGKSVYFSFEIRDHLTNTYVNEPIINISKIG